MSGWKNGKIRIEHYDRPSIEEVFAVLSNLENDLVVDIDSIYDDASMIPLCSNKRNSF